MNYKSKPSYVIAIRKETHHTIKDIQKWLTELGLDPKRARPEKQFLEVDKLGDGKSWAPLLTGMWLVADKINPRLLTTTTNERFIAVFEPCDGTE